MDGYSGKPLIEKLGYEPDDSVYIVNAPDWFARELGQHNVVALPGLPATWAHAFFTKQVDMITFLQTTDLKEIEKGLWMSWPKKASQTASDLTEQDFRDYILPLGWVDVKVAAIDDTWSGLKFVRRKT